MNVEVLDVLNALFFSNIILISFLSQVPRSVPFLRERDVQHLPGLPLLLPPVPRVQESDDAGGIQNANHARRAGQAAVQPGKVQQLPGKKKHGFLFSRLD